MATDAKKILKKLKGDDSENGRVTLYLNKRVYKDFRTACKDVPTSKVINEMMKEFIESSKKS